MKLPQFAIIGQPNVGKSTLFNALNQRSISIVDRTRGTTRDRLSATVKLNPTSKQFIELIDTGGLIEKDLALEKSSRIDKNTLLVTIQQHVKSAIQDADALIFVVDIKQGINHIDQWITRYLRRVNKPIIFVTNKADNPKHDSESSDFFSLGLDEPIVISALQRRGIDQLRTQLHQIAQSIKVTAVIAPEKESTPPLQLAIVGKRNAGKSTLVNTLAGADKVIVSEIPGTTRDAVDIKFTRDEKTFIAIDTAGLLHKAKITESVDFHSQSRTKRAIKKADVVLLLLDARTKVSELDKQISKFLIKENKPCVLAINKWDLVKDKLQPADYLKYLDLTLRGLQFAPISFISAQTGFNVWETINLAEDLYQQSCQKVKTTLINKILKKIHITRRPKGMEPKIYYAFQTGIHPPTITFKVNKAMLFDKNTQRYLINFLRKELPFKEVPIRLLFQGKEQPSRLPVPNRNGSGRRNKPRTQRVVKIKTG